MKKKDSVTGEEFECSGDTTCWCMDQPHVFKIEAGECIGPKHFEELIKEKANDTKSDF